MGGHGPNIDELDTDGREEVKARTMGHVRPCDGPRWHSSAITRVATTQPSATTRPGQPKQEGSIISLFLAQQLGARWAAGRTCEQNMALRLGRGIY